MDVNTDVKFPKEDDAGDIILASQYSWTMLGNNRIHPFRRIVYHI